MSAVGIYNVYGIKDESKIVIEQREVVYPKEDEQINDIHISNYKITENVFGKIFACNITDKFLLSTKKLPLFYISVVYEIPLKTVLLYRMYFSFNIEDNITCKEQLIGSPIRGKFCIELFLNNSQTVMDNNIGEFKGNDASYDKLKEFTVSEGMVQMAEIMVGEIVEQLKCDDLGDFAVPENIIKLKDYDVDGN
jgi:hypothetical protein